MLVPLFILVLVGIKSLALWHGQPRPDSVPHRVAVQNRKTLLSSAESKEGLAKQIAMFQEKVGRLEQEKEHWVLELQLLKIKYDNELQVGSGRIIIIIIIDNFCIALFSGVPKLTALYILST